MAGCVIPSTSRRATTRRPGGRAARRRPAVASRAAPGPPRGRACARSTGCHTSPSVVRRSKPGANGLGAPVTSRDAPARTPSSAGTRRHGTSAPGRPRPPSRRSGQLGENWVVQTVLGPLVGGLLAIMGGLLVALTSHRRERRRWHRDSQLQASVALLTALQTLVRRMIDLAYLEDKRGDSRGQAAIASYHEATIEWNSAMYAALLVSPPASARLIPEIDREVDRLLDEAMARSWSRTRFREERRALGRLAAGYLHTTRDLAGLPDIDLPSVWTWEARLPRAESPDTAADPAERQTE